MVVILNADGRADYESGISIVLSIYYVGGSTMSKLPYGMLIVMMCCVGVVFA